VPPSPPSCSSGGVLAAAAVVILGNVGGPGSLFDLVGNWLGDVPGLAGFPNAVLSVVFRAIDCWEVGRSAGIIRRASVH
jgi:hypothetical protein